MQTVKIKNSLAEFKKTMEEHQTILKHQLFECFREFFKENPEVKAIKWEQYTPYFNDGDQCVFHVRDFAFCNTADEEFLDEVCYGEYQGDESESEGKVYSTYDDIKESLKNNIKEFADVVNDYAFEDIFKSAFGDHVRVIATAEGFDVEEYSHD